MRLTLLLRREEVIRGERRRVAGGTG
jgi:hypothetical protein